MAPSRWVVNASPLILLGKTGQLGLLGALTNQIAIPVAVAEEVGARPDGKATLQAIAVDSVFVIAKNEVPTPEIMSWDLGAGETQVILSARVHGADRQGQTTGVFIPIDVWRKIQEQLAVNDPAGQPTAWDVLDSLTGSIAAPEDWAQEHVHYLYGTPIREESGP
jgi:hypothetical protein